MSGITDDDVTASVLAYGRASASGCRDKWLSLAGMRAAAKEIERRVLARANAEPRPMHEPVSDDEAQAMLAAGQGYITAMKQIKTSGNALLARRAAATRAEVVVTEEDVCRACHAWQTTGNSISEGMSAALQTFADRLNGKHATPVDPRVEIVRDWAQSYSIEPDDEPISELLAKLDEVKP